MIRFLVTGFVLLALLSPLQAAVDPDWLKKPYQLTVVLHLGEHPLLTPVFAKQLEQELCAALQRDLGPAGVVAVVRQHRWLDDMRQQGWGVLERPHPVDDRKWHFLQVSFLDGQYEMQARQVDGSTGLVSPLRRARTPDRLWVARLAALVVAQDFGVVGGVVPGKGNVVALQLKGTSAGDAVALRVQAGDVFALAEVGRRGRDGTLQGSRVPFTVLQVIDVRGDACTARLFQPRAEPLTTGAATLGYRAIKLGTQQAPLQLRVVDAKTGEPVRGCGVEVSPSGFDLAQNVDLGATDAQGRIRSPESYRNIVFVRLTQAGRARTPVPIALVDDQPVEIRLAGSAEAEAFAEFHYRYRQWTRQASATSLLLTDEIRKFRELEKRNEEQAAVAKARDLAGRIKEDLTQLSKGLEEVKGVGRTAGAEAAALLTDGEQYLAGLAAQARSLEEYVQREANPTPAQKLLKQARLMEESAEAEDAIKLYSQSLQEDPNQPAVKAHLQRLQDAWRLRGPAHEKARYYIYETWWRVDLDDLDKRLPEAEQALRACENAGDFLAAGKLLKLNLAHLDQLASLYGQLAPLTSEEDQEKAQALEKTVKALRELNQKAVAFLKRTAK